MAQLIRTQMAGVVGNLAAVAPAVLAVQWLSTALLGGGILTVADAESLAVSRDLALGLGARLLLDESEDPDERLYVFADPAGHPFCIFVAA